MLVVWPTIWTIITQTIRWAFFVINWNILKNLSTSICLSTKLYYYCKSSSIMYNCSFNNSLSILRQCLSDNSWWWSRQSHLECDILCVVSWTLWKYSSSYNKFLMNLRTIEIENNCITVQCFEINNILNI